MSNKSDQEQESSSSSSTTSKDQNSNAKTNDQHEKTTKESVESLEVQLPASINQISNSPLEYAYSFWFSKRPSKNAAAAAAASSTATSAPGQNLNYDANLRQVGTFNTVENFWYLYSHMTRPQDLQGHADIHMFKAGIRPLWEDDANKNGGKWIVRLKKGLATRFISFFIYYLFFFPNFPRFYSNSIK